MLLYSAQSEEFIQTEIEPEWVKAWMNKRQGNTNVPEDKTERTAEEQRKLDKAKEKTQADRFASVMAGAEELELWLKDLVRIGLLELPNKPMEDFEKVIARMVDAKAPGLAARVKSLAQLNFGNQEEWQNEALTIISKLFLLIKSFKNFENLNSKWQITIKNLVGWNQSAKELLADPEAETIQDSWLIVGQETEIVDEIISQRYWLVGCQSNRRALIQNYSTRFSPIEHPPVTGKILNAELAFFPSVVPHRAVIKLQSSYSDEILKTPSFFESWQEVFIYKSEYLKLNPWANDFIILLEDSRIAKYKGKWIIYDKEKNFLPVESNFDLKKIMTWLAISGNSEVTTALIMRFDKAMPVGIFKEISYILF